MHLFYILHYIFKILHRIVFAIQKTFKRALLKLKKKTNSRYENCRLCHFVRSIDLTSKL